MRRFVLLGGAFVAAVAASGACEERQSSGTTGSVYVAAPSANASVGAGAGGSGGAGGVGGVGGSNGGAGAGGATTSAGGGGAGGTLSCGTPIMIDDPATVSGDTTKSINHGDGNCQLGGAPDDVYQLTAANDGVLDVELQSSADLGVHVRSVCADPTSQLACVDAVSAGMKESLVLNVHQGDVLFVFIDGFSSGDFGPYTATIGTRATVCGDGIIDPGEQCDPPSPGTCDMNCQTIPEAGNCTDGIDNDGNGEIDCEDPACTDDPSCNLATECSEAVALLTTQAGDTTNAQHEFRGSCTGEGANEVIYTYESFSAGILTMSLQSTANLGMYQRETCTDSTSEVFCADVEPAAMNESFEAPIPPNVTETFFIDGNTATQKGAFTLTTNFTAANEVEPNDDIDEASSNPIASGTPAIGMIYPNYDVDYWQVTTTTPNQTITATIEDLGSGACAKGAIDSLVSIYDANMTFLDSDDDISVTNKCSSVSVQAPSPGNYYVEVQRSTNTNNAFGYKLLVTVQ